MSKIVTTFLSCLLVIVTFSLPTASANTSLVEGVDYISLAEKIAPTNAEQPIEVIEFFSYGCPYCAMIEPHVQAWLKQKPADVTFTRIAIPSKGRWLEYARTYYTLSLLDSQLERKITPSFYQAIHREKINFNNAEAIFAWVAKQGVDSKKFAQIYTSDEVTEKLKQAIEISQKYGVTSVPSLYVSGRYRASISSQRGYGNVGNIINQLIEKVRAD